MANSEVLNTYNHKDKSHRDLSVAYNQMRLAVRSPKSVTESPESIATQLVSKASLIPNGEHVLVDIAEQSRNPNMQKRVEPTTIARK